MMLHLGQDQQVAGFQVAAGPGVGDQVDGFGGVAGEDDLFRRRSMDELRHGGTCFFIFGGGFLGQGMHAAVDIGIIGAVKSIHRFEDGTRLLGGGGGIKVDQRDAGVHFPLQDGEIIAEGEDVQVHVSSIKCQVSRATCHVWLRHKDKDVLS